MRIISLLILLSLISCNKREKKVGIPVDHLIQKVPLHPKTNYLPYNSSNSDSFFVKWISSFLFDMKEPVLYNYKGSGNAVRLLWLRSLENPIVVRVNSFNDTAYVNVKELKLQPNENEKAIQVRDTIFKLESEIWDTLKSDLNKHDFRNAKSHRDSSLVDGSVWVLEVALQNNYHYIFGSDEGDLTSFNLNLFGKSLITLGERVISMKSIR